MRIGNVASKVAGARGIAAALAISAAIGVAACGGSSGTSTGDSASPAASTSGGSSKQGGTLTIGAALTPSSINPTLTTDGPPEEWYTELAYDPLIKLAPSTNKLEPGLAASWKYIGSGNKVFQFTLRKNVKFSDGEPLTAAGVVKFLKYFEANGAQGKQWLGGSTITTEGPLTVRIKLPKPDALLPVFFSNNATQMAFLIAPKGVKNPKLLDTQTLGAGPYMLDTSATVANSKYVYVPNPHYYDPSAIHWKKVVIQIIPTQSATLAALESNQIQVAEGDVSTVNTAKSAGLNVITAPEGPYGIFVTDAGGKQVPALKSPTVREALQYAIDRKAIATAVWQGYATTPAQQANVGMPGYDPSLNDAYSYNLKKAKQLLAQAGYPHGFSANMLISPQAGLSTMLQAVVADWKKIGVNVTIDSLPQSVWLNSYENKLFPFSGLGVSFMEIPVAVENFYTGPAARTGDYMFPDLAKLMAKFQTLPFGSAASNAVITQMNRTITDSHYFLFVNTPKFMWYTAKSVTGVTANPVWPIGDPTEWRPAS